MNQTSTTPSPSVDPAAPGLPLAGSTTSAPFAYATSVPSEMRSGTSQAARISLIHSTRMRSSSGAAAPAADVPLRVAVVMRPVANAERELSQYHVVEVLDMGDLVYWLISVEGYEPFEYPRVGLSASFSVARGAHVYRCLHSHAPRATAADADDLTLMYVLTNDLLVSVPAPPALQQNAPASGLIYVQRVRDGATGFVPREVVVELPLARTMTSPSSSLSSSSPSPSSQISRISPSASAAAAQSAACYHDLVTLILRKDMLLMRVLVPLFGTGKAEGLAESVVELFDDNQVAFRLIRFAIKHEVSTTVHSPTLFRSSTFGALVLSAFSKLVNREYLREVVRPALLFMMTASMADVEINPEMLAKGASLATNQENLRRVLQFFLNFIVESADRCPLGLRFVCAELHAAVESKFPGNGNSAIGGFLFLRNLCPAIVAPVHNGMLTEMPKEWMRLLILASKTLQTLANGTEFGTKESYMESMNGFVRRNKASMDRFFERLIVLSAEDREEIAYRVSIEVPSRDLPTSVYRRSSVRDIARILHDCIDELAINATKLDSDADEAALLVQLVRDTLTRIGEEEARETERLQRIEERKAQFRVELITARAGDSSLGVDLNSRDLAENGAEEAVPAAAMGRRAFLHPHHARDSLMIGMLDVSASDEINKPEMVVDLEPTLFDPPREPVPQHLLHSQSYEELASNFSLFIGDMDSEIEVQRRRRTELAKLLEFDWLTTSEMHEIVASIRDAHEHVRHLLATKEMLLQVPLMGGVGNSSSSGGL